MKTRLLLCSLLWASIAIGQVGIGSTATAPNKYAELDISSSTKGLLIPRLTSAQMTTLGTGAALSEQGLLIYNTNLHKFMYFDGTAWQQVGGNCIELTDENGDTKVQVEKTSNEDTIRFMAAGSEKQLMYSTGVTIKNANAVIQTGTLKFGTSYSLPSAAGNNGDVLGVNNSGVLSWRNPAAALGLVVGIESSSFSNVNQSFNMSGNVQYVRVVSWSNIVVTKMAFFLTSVTSGTSKPEMGIYDKNGVKLGSGIGSSITSAGAQVIEVSLSSSVNLVAGSEYWFALTDKTGSTMTVYDQIFNAGVDFSVRSQAGNALPASATFSIGSDKGVWMAAY